MFSKNIILFNSPNMASAGALTGRTQHTHQHMSDFESYKVAKEAFVSNLKGTTVTELMVLMMVMPAATLFGACMHATLVAGIGKRVSAPVTFATDFVCTIIPALLAVTVAAEWTSALLCFLVLASLALCCCCR